MYSIKLLSIIFRWRGVQRWWSFKAGFSTISWLWQTAKKVINIDHLYFYLINNLYTKIEQQPFVPDLWFCSNLHRLNRISLTLFFITSFLYFSTFCSVCIILDHTPQVAPHFDYIGGIVAAKCLMVSFETLSFILSFILDFFTTITLFILN